MKAGKLMRKTNRNLCVILANGRDREGRLRTVERLLKDIQSRPWTALKKSQPNDVALIYVGGPEEMKICGVAVVADEAALGVPDTEWTDSDKAYLAPHTNVRRLRRPVALQEIRQKFPYWKLWNRLDGHRVCSVPDELRKAVAKFVASKNPNTARVLAPWIGN
jgi:predicted RNA-binding protein with PUA-like domain